MPGSTISRPVARQVALGTARYGSSLTVTGTGSVAPRGHHETAITSAPTVDDAYVLNDGSMEGGAGGAAQPTLIGINGGAGIVLRGADADVANHGVIRGGAGGLSGLQGGDGGVGVKLSQIGTVSNAGTINGGQGAGGGGGGSGGSGGIGVDLAQGGMVVNSGIIAGGDPHLVGYQNDGGNGGAGIDLGGAGVVVNTGVITGGYLGFSYGRFGAAADAIDFHGGGVLENAGSIAAGSYGGVGARFLGGPGTVVNHGTITGGGNGGGNRPVGAGLELDAGGSIRNTGFVGGGQGLYSGYFEGIEGGGAGGSAVTASGVSQIVNSGTLMGGLGGDGYYNGATGGIGVIVLADGTAFIGNSGLIAGGAGGSGGYSMGAGGTGVSVLGSAQISNHGTIAGGAGSTSFYAYGTGDGGTGVSISGVGGRIVNAGLIEGGGVQDRLGKLYAGNGGLGVALSAGNSAVNRGTIQGGAGGTAYNGASDMTGSLGGIGVALTGGSLANHGIIAGGAGGLLIGVGGVPGPAGMGGAGVHLDGGTLDAAGGLVAGGSGGVQGDAVQFGATASTLEIGPRAIFSGDIVANPSVDDTLVLNVGPAVGRLSGFGSTITGFTTIEEAAHAHWRLDGAITGPGTLSVGVGASLRLGGAVGIAGIAFATHDVLSLQQPTQVSSTFSGFGTGDTIDLAGINATSFGFAGGVLALYGPGHHMVDWLSFSGSLSAANFLLVAAPDATEVLFRAGSPQG